MVNVGMPRQRLEMRGKSTHTTLHYTTLPVPIYTVGLFACARAHTHTHRCWRGGDPSRDMPSMHCISGRHHLDRMGRKTPVPFHDAASGLGAPINPDANAATANHSMKIKPPRSITSRTGPCPCSCLARQPAYLLTYLST